MTQSFMLPLLSQSATAFDCLSFPASKWIWEQQLAQSFPKHKFWFTGVEINPKVHRRMTRNAERLNNAFSRSTSPTFTPSPRQNLKTLLKRGGRFFDIIYADFMGTWSTEKMEDLEELFAQNALRQHGYLILTFSLMRDRGRLNKARALAMEFSKEGGDITVIDDHSIAKAKGVRTGNSDIPVRCRGIAALVRCMAREIAGIGLTPFPVHIYYNQFAGSAKAHPEVSLCFRRDS